VIREPLNPKRSDMEREEMSIIKFDEIHVVAGSQPESSVPFNYSLSTFIPE
jgi:hypothetical protein